MSGKVDRKDVQDYYGKVLKTKEDLKTSACCSSEGLPSHIRSIMSQLDDEILSKFYGCGSPIPDALEGCTVLDLGCGTGRDVFVISKLVGEQGRVIGVDMTDEQLEVANRHRDSMAETFGFKQTNVEFKKGYIEQLDELGIADESVDVVVSNCVVNLSFDKQKLLREIFRVLKPGGELYFSDVFTSRRIPEALKDDSVLIGECIAGAYYIEDFRRSMVAAGCPDVRIVASREIAVHDPDIKAKLGLTRLYSQTVRAFKLDSLEDRCEDFGQRATYLGSLPSEPISFCLDSKESFERGRSVAVSGNTALMLSESRFAAHFNVVGDRNTHYGLFDSCPVAVDEEADSSEGCC
jgi:arsenite methyltransferase